MIDMFFPTTDIRSEVNEAGYASRAWRRVDMRAKSKSFPNVLAFPHRRPETRRFFLFWMLVKVSDLTLLLDEDAIRLLFFFFNRCNLAYPRSSELRDTPTIAVFEGSSSTSAIDRVHCTLKFEFVARVCMRREESLPLPLFMTYEHTKYERHT